MKKSLSFDIDELEGTLSTDLSNISIRASIISKCSLVDRKQRAREIMNETMPLITNIELSNFVGFELSDALIMLWKKERYSNKDLLRVNYSPERFIVLENATKVLEILHKQEEKDASSLLKFKLAYVYECSGRFQESLNILSNLISNQASDGFELNFVIMKAAGIFLRESALSRGDIHPFHIRILLTAIGQYLEAITYLEYLLEEPPVHDGFKKSHILAQLIINYEKSGDKNKQLIKTKYQELQQRYLEELQESVASNSSRPTSRPGKKDTAYTKAMEMFAKKPIAESSEIWEQFGLQAVDRCEYALAINFFTEALSKAPNKGTTLHITAELFYLLDQKQQASELAQAAYATMPSSAELRNLLLVVAPTEFREKLRTAVPLKGFGEGDGDVGDEKLQRVDMGSRGRDKGNNSKLVPVNPAANDWEKEAKKAEEMFRVPVTESPDIAPAAGTEESLEYSSQISNPTAEIKPQLPTQPSMETSEDRTVSVAMKTANMRPQRNYDNIRKLVKPNMTEGAWKALNLAKQGNTQVDYIEPTLEFLARLRSRSSSAF